MSSHISPSASPCRNPSASATDHLAPLGSSVAASSSRRHSSNAYGSSSTSRTRGTTAWVHGLATSSPRLTAVFSAERKIRCSDTALCGNRSATRKQEVVDVPYRDPCQRPGPQRPAVCADQAGVVVEGLGLAGALDDHQPLIEPLAQGQSLIRSWVDAPERARSLSSSATFAETSVRVPPRTCRRTGLPASVLPIETYPCHRPSRPSVDRGAAVGRPATGAPRLTTHATEEPFEALAGGEVLDRVRRGLRSHRHSLFRGGFRRCAGAGNLRCLPELFQVLGGDQGAGADLEVAQSALLEQLVQHGDTHPQLGRGSTDRVHRARPGAVVGTSGVTAAACARAWASSAISRCNRSSSTSRCSRCASKRPISVREPAKEPGGTPWRGGGCPWLPRSPDEVPAITWQRVISSPGRNPAPKSAGVRGPAPACL